MNIILGSVASSIFDVDALRYIQAVEVADNQPLEGVLKTAINTFVVGLKTDGIWSNISCCGILAGARTLSGALVPLKGPQPTNFNFVAGDYSRSLGLSGDGLTKYIDTNEPNNSRPQNSSHISVYVSKRMELSGGGFKYLTGVRETGSALSGNDFMYTSNTVALSSNLIMGVRGRIGVGQTVTLAGGNSVGFKGGSRRLSNNTVYRSNNIELTSNISSSVSGNTLTQLLFATRNISDIPGNFTNAGLTFYSIGSATNLERLDNRFTTFMQILSVLV